MTGPLRIGDLIHGHVEGYFGRDFYECARVEAIAADWVVVRAFTGGVWFANGPDVIGAVEAARGPSNYPHSSGCPVEDA